MRLACATVYWMAGAGKGPAVEPLAPQSEDCNPTMNLKDGWDHLDPATQTWLINNPGCQILPRTIATVIAKETGGHFATGLHGEANVSKEDQAFIRSKAKEFAHA